MARPPVFPTWATAATYPAGSNDWSGQPPRIQPAGGLLAQGFTPAADIAAEYENWLFGVLADCVNYLDLAQGVSGLGDGSDGALTFNGSSTVLGLVPSSGVYTMARDIFASSLAVTTAGTQLITNGFRIYCRGQVSTTGGAIITANGGAGGNATGSPGTAGAASPTGSIGGGTIGGVGVSGSTAGNPGGNATNALGGAGGTGGGAGGAGGTATPPTATAGAANVYGAGTFGHTVGSGAVTPIMGGTGGGSGRATSSPTGGGGGGGGVVAIAARSIVLANVTDLQAKGGAGGAGTAGNASGGAGGGGGLIYLACGSLNLTPVASVSCAGGAAGAAFGAGSPGAVGSTGAVLVIPLAGI